MDEVAISIINLQRAKGSRATALQEKSLDDLHQRTDRLFAGLLILQWVAGIVAALWISPRTWAGASSQIHWHVWAAVFLGGAISGFPLFLICRHPGHTLTRHAIAVAQMLTSGLLIHLTGGRIETHFHVFGSLAILACYRDWRVLATATLVTAADHAIRGQFWPQSVFGVLSASPWRWLEHAGWVLFEDVFLIITIRQSLGEMLEVASRRARLEGLNSEIEQQVADRTSELRASETRKAAIVESALDCIITIDRDGRITEFNPSAEKTFGYSRPAVLGKQLTEVIIPTALAEEHRRGMARHLKTGEARILGKRIELPAVRADGSEFLIELSVSRVDLEKGEAFTAFIRDITERKRAEARVEELHQELVSASRQAGMAEVATGVLHNVGNVLNSVNVSASVILEKLRKSRVSRLGQVVQLLAEHKSDLAEFFCRDARGSMLPDYLAQLTDHLNAEVHGMTDELGSLVKNVEHIKQIVSSQQAHASSTGLIEQLDVRELVEDVIRVHAASLARHDINIVREFAEIPVVAADKHKVLQILFNLVGNAEHAMTDSPVRTLTLLAQATVGGGARVSVCDTGCGIARENITRIFAHGFTTKPDGHGFGLHSSALAAREMNGSLAVHSEGPGHGAVFALELPPAASEALAVNNLLEVAHA